METRFTQAQLHDAPIQTANDILRKCVHCGFCLATCPTYVILGNELDSPRGRIYQIKNMLELGIPAPVHTVKHVDRCLSCLAGMTTCPSGVDYMHLVDYARVYIEETHTRPLSERILRKILMVVLPNPKLFRLSLLGARLAQPFKSLLPGRL
ncbi:MAG: 4Fe-4S dicluster domain-containing protein, partial [Magnetovibrio sp.]|nr:4Fe-4S dicluster domain-containing protein [Magnetovibrio sp.]